MKKKRTYNTRRIKQNRSYTLQEIVTLYGVHINAVRNWIKAGLLCIDSEKPLRVHGGDLYQFLQSKQVKRKKPCLPHEAYCCKCRCTRAFWESTLDILIRNTKQLNLIGLCEVCATSMFKAGSVKKIAEYQKNFRVQTVRGEHLIPRINPPVNC